MIRGILFFVAVLWGFYGGALGAISTNVTVEGLGNVIGSINYTTWSNRVIYSFRSIPFAQPPVGDLRFRPPVKVTTWNGTLDATDFGAECPHSLAPTPEEVPYDLDEDCLTLNVFVPEVGSTVKSLPVLFFIFGGGFEHSYVTKYYPNYLLEEDVILVTTQFRVGPLGLMCLHTDEVPGNVMFLDQIMALQWVQDNIGYFGGDKDKVSLIGGSSGAATVNYHLFSPLSKGLFHQAGIHSGSALSGWALNSDPISSATELASFVGCNTTSIPSITACMKNATVRQIFVAYDQQKLTGTKRGTNIPVVQQAGEYKFMTEEPDNLLKNGNFIQVPLIGLVTKHDGTDPMNKSWHGLLEPNSLWNDTKYLQFNHTTRILSDSIIPDPTGAIADLLITAYFQNGELGDYLKMMPGLTDISGVMMFKAGVYKMLKHNSLYQKSYLTTFNYLGSYSKLNTTGTTYPGPGGVTHGDELAYLFPVDDINVLNASEIVIARRMVQLMTSFVKDGVPTADDVGSWPPMSTQFGPYLIVDKEATIGHNFLDEYFAATREAAAASSASSFAIAPILLLVLTAGSIMGRF